MIGQNARVKSRFVRQMTGSLHNHSGESEKLTLFEAEGEIPIIQMDMTGRATGYLVIFLTAARQYLPTLRN